MSESQTSDGRIGSEVVANVGVLSIDSPQRRNALGVEMYRAIPPAIEQLVDAGVRVIVVRGAGEVAFCAGSDVSEFATIRTPDNWQSYAEAEHHAHEALRLAPMPTIAAIHGFCRGGGLALALCADLRFASEEATFAVPPAKLGIGYPPDGLAVLAGIVGVANAKDLVLTARPVQAAEALDLGLVNQVVAKPDLDSLVAKTAANIANLAPISLRAAKAALNDVERRDSQPSELVNQLWHECYGSDDYAEGIAAFTEKRTPTFRGK